MNLRNSAMMFVFICLSFGCDEIRTKLHIMPNQDEQECLNSERLNFKDPDVIFVANLGDRGWKLEPETYWVRYKAKNAYGAYHQGNMLCKRSGDKWTRDISNEFLVSMAISSSLLEEEIRMMRADASYKSRFHGTAKEGADAAYETARKIMDESPEPLDDYYAKSLIK